MKVTVRLAAIGGAAVLLGALGTTAASASTWQPASGSVFVQTDNLGGNAVVAYQRAADGSLQQAGTYPTGGLGGHPHPR